MTMNQIYIYIFCNILLNFSIVNTKWFYLMPQNMDTFHAYFKSNLIITLLKIFSYGQCLSVFLQKLPISLPSHFVLS